MAKGRKKTLDEFVQEANTIHNNLYVYNKSVYPGARGKIEIICTKQDHGSFWQRCSDHLKGSGCSKCAKENAGFDIELFISKANEVHNFRYSYILVDYINQSIDVIIICKIHGEFRQRPELHLRGSGCRKCYNATVGQRCAYTLKEFIETANETHKGYYDYSYINEYIDNKHPVDIYCHKHGIFAQRPDVHLRGHGCPECSHIISSDETKWLDSLNIPKEYRQVKIPIRVGKFKTIIADGYDPITNTIYEFYGDYWHGNPKIKQSDAINSHANKTFGELYEVTMKRESLIQGLGYKIISMWESDWKKLTPGADIEDISVLISQS